MPKRKTGRKNTSGAIDMDSEKKKLGRPREADWVQVYGRSKDLHLVLSRAWNSLEHPFMKAKNQTDYRKLMGQVAVDLQNRFPPTLFGAILKTRRDRKRPKTKRALIKFFAESLAALDEVTPRRSRDICDYMRNNPPPYIKRVEFYIECSCGHKDPSVDRKCPKCGAAIGMFQLAGITEMGGS